MQKPTDPSPIPKHRYDEDAHTFFDHAECRDEDPNLFFPPQERPRLGQEKARAVCRQCPVAGACLSYALDNKIDHGMWGGHTARERRRLRRLKKAAAAA